MSSKSRCTSGCASAYRELEAALRTAAGAVFLLACALACGPAAAPETPAREGPEFSGEIVYKRLLASEDTGGALTEVTPIRYFISGPRWKHCHRDGTVIAEYFPDRNVVEMPGPWLRTVDAGVSSGTPHFEYLTEMKRVLRRKCSGLRKTAPHGTMTAFYDPDLFVEPRWYPNHHFGDWTELLSATNGALPLWWRSEEQGVTLVFEAIRIDERVIPDELWGKPCPPARE